MFVKTCYGALVNFDKVCKVDISAVDAAEWVLRGWFDDYKATTFFTGKSKADANLAMANLEEALHTGATSIDYSKGIDTNE